MARKKKQIKKPNTRKILWGTIGLSFLLEIFMVWSNTGVFGRSVQFFFFRILGLGSYLVFPLLIVHCSLVLLEKFQGRNRLKTYLAYGLFLDFLLLLDFYHNSGNSLRVRLLQALDLAAIRRGGGLVGAFLSFVLGQLIGKVGIYLISLLMIFAFSLVFLNLSLKELLLDLGAKARDLGQGLGARWEAKKKARSGEKNRKKKLRAWPGKERDLAGPASPGRVEDPLPSQELGRPALDPDQDDRPQPVFRDYSQGKTEEQVHMNIFSSQTSNYSYPPIELLREGRESAGEDRDNLLAKAGIIEDTLRNFQIDAQVEAINRGPQITSYELVPQPGVKVSRIVNLADDLSLALASSGIRIEAPIPGKAAVGIEVPNDLTDLVSLREIIHTSHFQESDSKLTIALGKSIHGQPIVSSIDRMPHLLIAGATGSGKSVCINTIILSLLYKSSPDDVKLILIDPKVVELSIYNDIPHLAIPVVTNPQKAAHALNWAVSEMERRYQIFSENFVRDITSYNEKIEDLGEEPGQEKEKLPFIVIIIDELSDLMMVASQEVEDAIVRLSQMARACGIHLIIATQRPTVDVITGTIKANVPSRISFAVSSQIDSRTILDSAGAEKLLGKGDMLFYPANLPKPLRIQGAFVSDREVEQIVQYLREKNPTDYNEEIIEDLKKKEQGSGIESEDALFKEAVRTILEENSASISLLQRKLKVGYARAGRLIDEMEEQGIVGGHEGSKPRKILVSRDFLEGGDNQ